MRGERLRARAVALAALLAAPLAAGPGKAELQAQYQQVIAALGQHNAEGAKNGTTGTAAYRTRMMELIGEMQRLQLAIAAADKPATPSPWEGMDSSQLEAERKRLDGEARAAEAAGDSDRASALYRQLNEVGEAYNLAVLRGTSGRALGAQDDTETVSVVDAMRFFQEGDVERGLNAYEAVIASGLTRDNAGAAVNLAGFYLDLVADTDKALRHAQRVEAFCEAKLGPTLGDLGDDNRLLMVRYRRSARLVQVRAMAAARERKKLADHLTETARLLEAERAAFPPAPADAVPATIFQVEGLFQLAVGHLAAAGAARAKGDEAEATAAFQAALARFDEMASLLVALPDQDRFEVMNWTNITNFRRADVLQDLGRTAEALPAWERYFEGEKAYGENAQGGHYYALAKVGHARSLAAAGRLEEAVAAAEAARARFLDEAGKIQMLGPYRALAWKPSLVLGDLHRRAGERAAALTSYREAIRLIEDLYARMRSGTLKGSFLNFDECGAAYDAMVTLHLEAGELAEALAVLDRSKSAVLLDMLRSQPMRERNRWPPRLLERERELKRRLRELKPSGEVGGDGTRSGKAADPAARRQTHQDYELFLREVQQSLQPASEASPARKVDAVWAHGPDELARVATGGRVVVAYFDDGAALRAFVVKDGAVQVHPAGESAEVAKAASKLRRNVTARSKRWERPAAELYEALVAPWAAALEGATELVVVPTGELFALPFAALPDAEGRSLASKVPLSFVSQLSLLAESAGPSAPATGALVIADPDGSLPFAREEGARVAKAIGEAARVLEGEAATEGTLKARVGFLRQQDPPGTLHLATHGLLDKGAHLLSSLVMAPDDLEDGALTFQEIFNDLDLRRTPVVVLSACNTAVGETRGGDEVAGLARAFQYAGAEWVVASLWEVSDAASAALMVELHRALAAGQPVDRALRAAQQALPQQNEDWSHPYFWAAFAAYRR